LCFTVLHLASRRKPKILTLLTVDVGDGPRGQGGERLSHSPGKCTGMLAFDGSIDGGANALLL
jgi:hypothetical protein